MKTMIFTLVTVLAFASYGQTTIRIKGQYARTLGGILKASGVRVPNTLAPHEINYEVSRIHCDLSIQAPGAAFAGNCVLNSRFGNTEFHVDRKYFGTLVNLLVHSGVKPLNTVSQIILTTAYVGCAYQSDIFLRPVPDQCVISVSQ